jgi:hypothetical protein
LAAFWPVKSLMIMQKKWLRRRVITGKDIQLILGASERSARRLMQRLRKRFKKKPDQYVSVLEFCEFAGLTEAEVADFFNI